jgi:hypothetical protein
MMAMVILSVRLPGLPCQPFRPGNGKSKEQECNVDGGLPDQALFAQAVGLDKGCEQSGGSLVHWNSIGN